MMEWSWCSCTSSPTTSCAISTIPTFAFPVILTSAPSTRNTFRKLRSHSSQFLRHPSTEPVCPRFRVRNKVTESELEINPSKSSEVDCIGTGLDVECVISPTDDLPGGGKEELVGPTSSLFEVVRAAWEFGLLISPFFFWGTAMVAMKEVLPKTGPFFVSAFRLIPSGFLLIAFAAFRGRGFPSGFRAWLSISAFALVDASCFQGFLAEGLERTTAGLGSVIIDSQPLTVAILASVLFGESMGPVGAVGLVLGVVGLLLLEVPAISFDNSNFSLWGSGEWWMLLAAQSMAIGTVMVRWVSKYSDPIMATGWHMVIGGLPLLAISIINHDPVFGSYDKLTNGDLLALLYTSIFGSAISYGVYFYNATRGSLTKLSSLTFLTPMFASVFGFLYLDETFTPVQLVGALITVAAIYMVNFKTAGEAE
ncbi:WAT1-related protein At3g02690, chloroplastic [Henckelia pumila]|uniref:WAT1-related protein At3g02690, chloroplastic n=1 Tax=Henckelia pumila TaxID=405737 RepID=UPI003C6E455B